MGAVTARQRESIPAGTGTTDPARETADTSQPDREKPGSDRQRKTDREKERERERESRERPSGSGREREPQRREGKASSIKREEQEVAAEAMEAENDGRRGTSLAHRRTRGANAAEQSADTCPPPFVTPSALFFKSFETSYEDESGHTREEDWNLYFGRRPPGFFFFFLFRGCPSVFSDNLLLNCVG